MLHGLGEIIEEGLCIARKKLRINDDETYLNTHYVFLGLVYRHLHRIEGLFRQREKDALKLTLVQLRIQHSFERSLAVLLFESLEALMQA